MATIIGTSGSDIIEGFGADDMLFGVGGDDTLNGGAGRDTMTGGNGNDFYLVDNAGDVAVELAGEGDDTLYASTAFTMGANIEIGRLFGLGSSLGVAADQTTSVQLVLNPALASTVLGGAGDDLLWGGSAGSTMFGRDGNDILRDQGSPTTMNGGRGNDQFVISSSGSVIIEKAGEGIDTAWVAVDGFTVSDHVEITRLGVTATMVLGANTDDQVVANPLFGSTLFGRGGADILWGSGFADLLDGGEGDDIIRGQGGADTMVGGVGNDQFIVLDAGVVIIENAGEGYETAWIDLPQNTPFTLAANVERGNMSGAANILTGNASDNVLVGNAVASRLDGMAGNDLIFGSGLADTLTGGAGDDTLYCFGGADRLVYATADWGFDLVSGFASADGARFDFRGSGLQFSDLTFTEGGGNTQVNFGANAVLVFGTVLVQGDFIFG